MPNQATGAMARRSLKLSILQTAALAALHVPPLLPLGYIMSGWSDYFAGFSEHLMIASMMGIYKVPWCYQKNLKPHMQMNHHVIEIMWLLGGHGVAQDFPKPLAVGYPVPGMMFFFWVNSISLLADWWFHLIC